MPWFQAKPVNPPKWYEIKDKQGGKKWYELEKQKARPEYVDKYTWNKVAKHFGLPTMTEPHMQHPAGFWDWAEQNGLTDKFYLKEHIQKYVSPPKTPTRATFLRISQNQSARDFGEELPPGADGAAEATDHWQRWLDENKPIVIPEDAGKKSACIINHVPGVMSIGIPGICNGVRSEKDSHGQLVPNGKKSLISELEPFATSGRIVYIGFDRDKKLKTRLNVNREIKKAGELYTFAGCNVYVVSWPIDWGKGIDDVWANGHNIQDIFDKAIPFKEFLACEPWKHSQEPDLQEYRKYYIQELENEIIANAEERRRQELYSTAWEVWKKSRSLTALPGQTVSQQWISFDLPPIGTGLGVKSAMGTGKTEQIKNILAQAGENSRLFFIAPTNTLNHQACKRLVFANRCTWDWD